MKQQPKRDERSLTAAQHAMDLHKDNPPRRSGGSREFTRCALRFLPGVSIFREMSFRVGLWSVGKLLSLPGIAPSHGTKR